MGNSIYWLMIKTLYVLWLVILPSSATSNQNANSSRPAFKQCLGHTDLSSLLNQSIAIHDIRLLHALHSQPRIDQDGKPMESYKDLYESFQRRTDCLPWQTVVDRWHSHEEIKTLAHTCLCTSIRNGLVANVHRLSTCAITTTPLGQLPAFYLALGRRINLFKRQVVRMHSTAAMLRRYDALVDECFTQFFQRVATTIQPIQGAAESKSATASEPTKPQATQSKPVKPVESFQRTDACDLPWALLVLLMMTAVACTLLFVHHILLWRPTRLLPPPTVAAAAAAVDSIIARTDDVHDD